MLVVDGRNLNPSMAEVGPDTFAGVRTLFPNPTCIGSGPDS